MCLDKFQKPEVLTRPALPEECPGWSPCARNYSPGAGAGPRPVSSLPGIPSGKHICASPAEAAPLPEQMQLSSERREWRTVCALHPAGRNAWEPPPCSWGWGWGGLRCYKARKTISLKINRSQEIDGLEKFLGESLGPVYIPTVSNGSAHGRNSYVLRPQRTHAPQSRKRRPAPAARDGRPATLL